jgi:transposase
VKHYPHHEAADKYPMIEGEAFEAFKADIKANGQRLPIYIQSCFIIDGRNRQKACADLGIEAVYQEVEGDPYELAESLNLHRRHLTKEQRNDLIVKKGAEGKSTRQIAEEVGTNKETVRQVLSAGANKLPPEQQDKVVGKDGKTYKRKPNANGNKPSVDDAKVAELGRAGLSEEAIAESLGTTRRAVVCSFTRQAKEQLRKEGEALPAQCEEAKQELSLTAQQKLDKAIALFEQKKLAEMQQEFQVELAAAVAAKQEKLEALIQSAKEQEHAAKQLRQQLMDARATVDRIMTYEEFKIVRGLLHPDRYPDDLKDRAGKAFDIFNRLEKCVNPNIGVAELRKRGWEHLSPYGRRKSA